MTPRGGSFVRKILWAKEKTLRTLLAHVYNATGGPSRYTRPVFPDVTCDSTIGSAGETGIVDENGDELSRRSKTNEEVKTVP